MCPLQAQSLHARFSRTARVACAGLIASLAACVSPAGEPVDHSTLQAHNQRPFIGRDTQTTADSFFELEVGGAVDPGNAVDTPLVVKYGLGPRSELFAGTTPYTKTDKNELEPDGSGWGDSLIGVRHRFRDKDMYSPALGFQIATKLPTASKSKGLGSGELDFLGALIAEQTYYGTDVAGFYQFGVLGEPDSGVNIEHTFSAQARRPLNKDLLGFAETAFIWEPELNREEFTVMGGLAFVIDDFTLFDVGLRLGLTNDAPDAQILFGLTRTLGLIAFPQAGALGK